MDDMKPSLEQYCMNGIDLERSVHFFEKGPGVGLTHRIEKPNGTDALLAGEDGNRIQRAGDRDRESRMEHGNGVWRRFSGTDEGQADDEQCLHAGAESILALERGGDRPLTAAWVHVSAGFMVERLQRRQETPKGLSRPNA